MDVEKIARQAWDAYLNAFGTPERERCWDLLSIQTQQRFMAAVRKVQELDRKNTGAAMTVCADALEELAKRMRAVAVPAK